MKRTILSLSLAAAMSASAAATEYPDDLAWAHEEIQQRVDRYLSLCHTSMYGCHNTRILHLPKDWGTQICWQEHFHNQPPYRWGFPHNPCVNVAGYFCDRDSATEWKDNPPEDEGGRQCVVKEYHSEAPENESKRVCVSRQLPDSDDVEFIDGSNYVVIRKSMDGESVEVSEIEDQTDFEERCHVFDKKETVEEEQYWSVAQYEVIFGSETTSHDWIINVFIRGETYFPFTQGQATQFQDMVFPSGQENKRIPMHSIDPFEKDQRNGETYYRFDIPAWGGGDTKVVIGTGMVWGTDL